LIKTSGTQNAHLKKTQVFETFKDVRVWLVCLCTLLSSIPNGGISNFSSILLTTFGYSPRQALILAAPGGAPYFLPLLWSVSIQTEFPETKLVSWRLHSWVGHLVLLLCCCSHRTQVTSLGTRRKWRQMRWHW